MRTTATPKAAVRPARPAVVSIERILDMLEMQVEIDQMIVKLLTANAEAAVEAAPTPREPTASRSPRPESG